MLFTVTIKGRVLKATRAATARGLQFDVSEHHHRPDYTTGTINADPGVMATWYERGSRSGRLVDGALLCYSPVEPQIVAVTHDEQAQDAGLPRHNTRGAW